MLLNSFERGTGFRALSLRPSAELVIDPFLAIDVFTMTEPTFPPHPHAGFPATTVLHDDSEGSVVNQDSLGATVVLEPGSVHWTQAGWGVTHEEVPERGGVPCRGLQVFVNSSAEFELNRPKVFHASADSVPLVEPVPGVSVRVLAGEAFGERSPVSETDTRVAMLEVKLGPRTEFELPIRDGENAFVLALEGAGSAGRAALSSGEASSVDSTRPALLAAGPEGLRAFVGSGVPLSEPVYWEGSVALSSKERALEAMRRFRSGELGELETLAKDARRSPSRG